MFGRGETYEPLDVFVYRWQYVIKRLGRFGRLGRLGRLGLGGVA